MSASFCLSEVFLAIVWRSHGKWLPFQGNRLTKRVLLVKIVEMFAENSKIFRIFAPSNPKQYNEKV